MTMHQNLKIKIMIMGTCQLTDLSRPPFVDNEVGYILIYNEELGDNSILCHHSDIPEDLCVIRTTDIASEMSNAASFRPISFLPTLVFLMSYTGVYVSVQMNVAHKSVPATMIGPTISQHKKQLTLTKLQ